MKLSERYQRRLVAARECWRICKLWLETVSPNVPGGPFNDSPYAKLNEIKAHFECVRLERRFLRAVALEEARANQLASFDAFKAHRMPLP